ncbi:MAG TPA: class I SAM-dependent methyltransferase [Acidimicrobiia bacterium]|nr:class I SAM-dependent methyltransferase [Acidimicrobiia bacterium]
MTGAGESGVPSVDRLDEIARGYDPSDPTQHFDYWLKRLQVQCISPWLRGERVLELGCATGELTSLLAPLARAYDVVEGSPHNVEIAQARVPNATFFTCMWEDFTPAAQYTDLVMFNALEHSADPVGLLHQIRPWLAPGGRAHIVVPNGLSLHRLVGVEMGLQPDPLALTAGDTAQGHLRNYTVESLTTDLQAGGLTVAHMQPVFLKVLPNTKMLDWEWPLIEAMHHVAQRFPENGAEIYAVGELS